MGGDCFLLRIIRGFSVGSALFDGGATVPGECLFLAKNGLLSRSPREDCAHIGGSSRRRFLDFDGAGRLVVFTGGCICSVFDLCLGIAAKSTFGSGVAFGDSCCDI